MRSEQHAPFACSPRGHRRWRQPRVRERRQSLGDAIKARKGKLRFTESSAALIDANGFLPLAISPAHTEAAGALAWDHHDPFDRMLVVHSRLERLVLVHADPIIRAYGGVTHL